MEERVSDARRKVVECKELIDNMIDTAFQIRDANIREKHFNLIRRINNNRSEILQRLDDGSRMEVIDKLFDEIDQMKQWFEEGILFDILGEP